MASLKQTLLQRITRNYLDSRDFNGTPLFDLAGIGTGWMRALRALVREGKVSVVFGDRHPNAHIKAFPSEHIEEQLAKLKSKQLELQRVCAYPTEGQLASPLSGTASGNSRRPRRTRAWLSRRR